MLPKFLRIVQSTWRTLRRVQFVPRGDRGVEVELGFGKIGFDAKSFLGNGRSPRRVCLPAAGRNTDRSVRGHWGADLRGPSRTSGRPLQSCRASSIRRPVRPQPARVRDRARALQSSAHMPDRGGAVSAARGPDWPARQRSGVDGDGVFERGDGLKRPAFVAESRAEIVLDHEIVMGDGEGVFVKRLVALPVIRLPPLPRPEG